MSVMRSFFGGVFGIAALIVGIVAWGQNSLGAGILWGLLALGLLIGGAGLSQSKPSPKDLTDGEDLVAKENNRKVAMHLADMGGMPGVMARQWLQAYGVDNSLPIFGARPYWTPSGPGGAPELLSLIGLRGADKRLQYVREAAAGDILLEIIADDPNPRVRDAARARLR